MLLNIRTYSSLPSTNAEAMRLGLAGVTAPFWVRAEQQTAGRGRSGRLWVSEPGNLYASLLVQLTCAPVVLHQLSFVAAVATVAAVRRSAGPLASGLSITLKWPNDILLGGAKLTGILAESTLQPDGRVLAVIGIGVNLAHAPVGIGRATTCLAAHGVDITAAAMLAALAAELDRALVTWAEGQGFSVIRGQWLADSFAIGTPMTVHAAELPVIGTFAGLGADGALILRDHSGYDRTLTFGDVTLDAAPRG